MGTPPYDGASGTILGQCHKTDRRTYAANLRSSATGASRIWVSGSPNSFASWGQPKVAIDKRVPSGEVLRRTARLDASTSPRLYKRCQRRARMKKTFLQYDGASARHRPKPAAGPVLLPAVRATSGGGSDFDQVNLAPGKTAFCYSDPCAVMFAMPPARVRTRTRQQPGGRTILRVSGNLGNFFERTPLRSRSTASTPAGDLLRQGNF